MQLKLSYYIATNVCSRKSATTFGDLPDCLVSWMDVFVDIDLNKLLNKQSSYIHFEMAWYSSDVSVMLLP